MPARDDSDALFCVVCERPRLSAILSRADAFRIYYYVRNDDADSTWESCFNCIDSAYAILPREKVAVQFSSAAKS
jgi:hypothetical protein